MQKLFRPPGGETTLNSLLLFCAGIYAIYKGASSGVSLLLAGGLLFALIGAGLWFRQGWARVLGLLGVAGWCVFFWWRVFALEFSFWNLAVAIGGLWILKDIWQERFDDEQSAPGSLISIVLFLREPCSLSLEQARDLVIRAWGVKLGDDREAKEWIGAMGPSFAMVTRFGVYALHVAPHPYVEDREEAAKDVKDARLAQILREHKAWYAVDLMRVGEDVPTPEKAYPYIGQLLAELVDDNCLGVYCPETERMNPNTPELVEKLRGPDPLAELTAPLVAPVVQISDNDPRMKAAVTEAREHWPEFAQKFESGVADHYAIKAPVSSGEHCEFIWIEVKKIEGDQIIGVLANDPMNLPGLKLGSSVTVPLAELNDWIYEENGEMKGGFTIKVLTA